jgi:23S rRNA (cytidine2498-2'-O)-methyltransferase
VIPPASEHVFALCNPGSETALKLEARSAAPDWRPGYQRRGFVTFKVCPHATGPDLAADIACARRLCLSLGKSTDSDSAIQRLGKVDHLHHARFANRAMQGVPTSQSQPQPGDWVGTVVELAPDEFWSGIHRHTPLTSPDPAGDAAIEMPPDSPSRAWLKLEEAVRFFDLRFTPQDVVAELGCAPGGVVLALLRRGVSVIGVDPAKMSEVVLPHAILDRSAAPPHRPWFYHCRKPAALVGKRDLGRDTTWFMSDMNQSPDVVLKECARFCRMAPGIRGVLITLKLTDLSQIAEKPAWRAALAAMGFTTIRLQQLAVHHREFALLAMR